jgi:hypothetical protein
MERMESPFENSNTEDYSRRLPQFHQVLHKFCGGRIVALLRPMAGAGRLGGVPSVLGLRDCRAVRRGPGLTPSIPWSPIA